MASEQEREDMALQREQWREFQAGAESSRLVFIDESGAQTNMSRLYGRARQGQRCYDKAPCRWKTVTVLSSIRLDGETESVVFEGAVDRKMFDTYIQHILGPSLRSGDIVILDNLSSHPSRVAQEIVQSRAAKYLFLPACRPDFNPIEKMWSKIKQILREIKARTPD